MKSADCLAAAHGLADYLVFACWPGAFLQQMHCPISCYSQSYAAWYEKGERPHLGVIAIAVAST